jgi:hypothetical protein
MDMVSPNLELKIQIIQKKWNFFSKFYIFNYVLSGKKFHLDDD